MQERALETLAALVASNLIHQHGWTGITSHVLRDRDPGARPRLIISGLPRRKLYIHPDQQIEVLKADYASEPRDVQEPEFEWVLPLHVTESVTMASFASWFDSISILPPGAQLYKRQTRHSDTHGWSGPARHKRFLIALLHDDSTVSYYLMHDGIIKPRQN